MSAEATHTHQNPMAVTEDCPNAGVIQKREILAAIAKLRAFACSNTGALGQWTADELTAMKREIATVKTLLAELGEGDLTQLSQDVQAVRDILAQFDADGDGRIDAVAAINARLGTMEGRLTAVVQTQAQHTQTLASQTEAIAQQSATLQTQGQQLQTLGQRAQDNTQAISTLRGDLTDQICAERRLQASFLEGLGAEVDALLAVPCPLPISVMNPPDPTSEPGGNSEARDPSQLI